MLPYGLYALYQTEARLILYSDANCRISLPYVKWRYVFIVF